MLSRVTAIFEDQGLEPSGQERYIAETFCERAAPPRPLELRPDRVERRRPHDRDREARLQTRRIRLRAVRLRLDASSSAADSASRTRPPSASPRSPPRPIMPASRGGVRRAARTPQLESARIGEVVERDPEVRRSARGSCAIAAFRVVCSASSGPTPNADRPRGSSRTRPPCASPRSPPRPSSRPRGRRARAGGRPARSGGRRGHRAGSRVRRSARGYLAIVALTSLRPRHPADPNRIAGRARGRRSAPPSALDLARARPRDRGRRRP